MASTSTKTLLTKAKVLGAGDGRLELSDKHLHALFQFVCDDLGWEIGSDLGMPPVRLPSSGYYGTPLDWFEAFDSTGTIPDHEVLEALQRGIDKDGDFGLYVLNLSSLHKRRLKYRRILEGQPKPTMNQVGPRSLLEFGLVGDELLASWMKWRKWIFDIDNRSGQETGYLFEPVLASCIGGTSISSTRSPVKRLVKDPDAPAGGRQIDCYVASEKTAYEFKLRVSIAASGQGRFGEELSFPAECRLAEITPILLVLDPTPSSRLAELSGAFVSNGGSVLIGGEAWSHLDEKAGPVMSRFIDRYIKPPLERMAGYDDSRLLDISLSWSDGQITITGESDSHPIKRTNK